MPAPERKTSRSVRIVLVDDHEIVREGLRHTLVPEPDFEIIGEAGDGHTALKLVEQLLPAIVVMDLGLPDGDGLSFARQMLARWPACKVIILSGLADRQHLDEAIEAGVTGYVVKVNASRELIRAIRAATRGETYLCPEATTTLLGGYKELLAVNRQLGRSALSEREAEVLRLIADGCNTKEVAGKLGLSVKTVETHRVRIMSKLDLHSVAELTKYAIRIGLTPP